ncbi:hypothetical protein NDU88_004672 [Pleurodeles waltl]|uniref:Uncharacterized protein n=1 Tax=Pleurodeles waltl TaxID=8319 RepID=A0AAV7RLZ5_PLEWA|nr:hypothetical protein NDU88_004672 [Pleurodeles waltl]
MPILDFPDDMDDELTKISQQTLQDVLGTLQTTPSVARKSTDAAAITEDPPTTPIVRSASSNPAEDSEDTGTTVERTVVGVQRELAKEVGVGTASLEGMLTCMMSSAEQAAAIKALPSLLQVLQQCVRDFTTAVKELPQHLASQNFHCVHECNHDPLRADLAATTVM